MIELIALAILSLPPSPQGSFVERALEVGVTHEISTGFDRVGDTGLFDWLQRGIALADVDGDGDLDLLCCGGVLPNTVLLNVGGTFADATAAAGVEVGDFDTAFALGDLDGDGDLDLYVAVCAEGGSGGGTEGRGRMYRNDGTGAFEEVSALAAAPGRGHSTFAQWVDLDVDGLLDLYVSEFFTTKNLYYRNNGDGTFTELGAAVGLDVGGSTHVTAVLDVDRDGNLDVLVGNDYIVSKWPDLPDNLGDRHVRGLGEGAWSDVSAGSAFDVERGIMGYALGDVDYDGDLDVYRTDMDANHMVINQGWPSGAAWLPEEQDYYGVAAALVPWPEDPSGFGKGVGWGAVFADLDNDPWLDLFLVNGQVSGFHPTSQFSPRDQPNFLWTGDGPGAGFTFTDQTVALGIHDEIDDRTVAAGDVDDDGDVDLFVGPTAGFVRYFENQLDPAGQGWLKVAPLCNTSAPGGVGVVVRYTDSLGYPHLRQLGLDGSTASQHEHVARFGLGTEPAVDLEVEFPSGVVLAFPSTTPNQTVVAVEPELVRPSARTLPIAPNPGAPGTRSAPTGTVLDGLYSVSAFAHTPGGVPLGAGASVTIDVPGLVPLTDVLHVQGSEFRRYFLKPTLPGAFRAEVSFDGWAVKVRPRVLFYDPADCTGTTVELRPEAVRAGGTDVLEVVVAPKDGAGVSLGPGDAVEVLLDGQAPLAGVQDLGDGRYRATFAAPAAPGKLPVNVSVNGVALPASAPLLEVGGPAVAAKSSLEVMAPSQTQAASPHQLKLLATPRDIDGNRLGPEADVQVVLLLDPDSDPAAVRADLYPRGQRDGEFVFVVEKELLEPPAEVHGMIAVVVDGLTLAQVPFSY